MFRKFGKLDRKNYILTTTVIITLAILILFTFSHDIRPASTTTTVGVNNMFYIYEESLQNRKLTISCNLRSKLYLEALGVLIDPIHPNLRKIIAALIIPEAASSTKMAIEEAFSYSQLPTTMFRFLANVTYHYRNETTGEIFNITSIIVDNGIALFVDDMPRDYDNPPDYMWPPVVGSSLSTLRLEVYFDVNPPSYPNASLIGVTVSDVYMSAAPIARFDVMLNTTRFNIIVEVEGPYAVIDALARSITAVYNTAIIIYPGRIVLATIERRVWESQTWIAVEENPLVQQVVELHTGDIPPPSAVPVKRSHPVLSLVAAGHQQGYVEAALGYPPVGTTGPIAGSSCFVSESSETIVCQYPSQVVYHYDADVTVSSNEVTVVYVYKLIGNGPIYFCPNFFYASVNVDILEHSYEFIVPHRGVCVEGPTLDYGGYTIVYAITIQ